MKRSVTFLLMVFCAAYANAGNFYSKASVSVQDLVKTFPAGKQRLVQQVKNSGDAPAFVKVEVFEILNPHTDHEREEPLDMTTVPDLVATPQRIVIPPHASRGVGLFLKERWNKDRFFRVRFTPVRPTKAEGFVQTSEVQTGASIGIAWGTLVVVPRQQASYNTEIKQDADQLKIKNLGNSYVQLTDVEICTEKECKQEFDQRVLVDESQGLSTEGIKSISATLVEGDSTRKLSWHVGNEVEIG